MQDRLNQVETYSKQRVIYAFREAAITFGGIDQERAELFLTGADVDTLKRQAAQLAADSQSKPGHVPGEGNTPMALNGDPLEQALRAAVGA